MEIQARTHRQLLQDAQRNGICDAWYQQMRDEKDSRQLLDMYLRGIDFCLLHEYPGMDILKRYQAEAQAAGIFVDCDGMRRRNPRKTVCLGATAGLVTFDDNHVGSLYIKHDSTITLTARDNAFVMVDLFDKASLVVEAWDDAKICVNVYAEDGTPGPMLDTKTGGDARIKVINKHKKSYK